jgi:GntR family transcriptional regulator/MocR family aminotransferase
LTRGKTAVALDLPRPSALAAGTPHAKGAAIAAALRAAIVDGRLACGSPLPSSRTLAARWGVARGTVEASFDRLRAEGYIARVRGAGTRVSAILPDACVAASVAAERMPAPPSPAAVPAAGDMPTSGSTVRAGVPFVARMADARLLAPDVWQRHLLAGLRATEPASPAEGLPALRAQIARYLGTHRGIACTADDVIVTTGIRHALDLFARVAVTPGARVLVEDPGYPAARQLFALAGARVVDVPVDRDGIDTDALAGHAGAAAVYVTPAHQSPLGVTLSVPRRHALLAWAEAAAAWIVEDDYDGEFGYQAAPLPALKSLDAHGRVLYCGSFNKSLFSGLRVGFMVAPPALRGRLTALLQLTGRAAGVHEQHALAGLIAAGDFARHLRTSRHAYQQRRDAVLDQLRRHAPGRWTATGDHAGFHFVLWLAPDADADDLARRGAAIGLQLQPLGALCRSARPAPALVLGYTALTPAQARHAGRQLAHLLAEPPASFLP